MSRLVRLSFVARAYDDDLKAYHAITWYKQQHEKSGFGQATSKLKLISFFLISGLIGQLLPGVVVSALASGTKIVAGVAVGNMFTYLSIGSGAVFPFIWLMVRQRRLSGPQELLREKSFREGERILLLNFADYVSRWSPRLALPGFYKSEPSERELETNSMAETELRHESDHHAEVIQSALLHDAQTFNAPKPPSTMKLELQNRTDILILRHWFGFTLQELGKAFGVSRERIRTIEATAFRHMNRSLRNVIEDINDNGHIASPLIVYVSLLSERGLQALEERMRKEADFRERVLNDLLEESESLGELSEAQRMIASRLLSITNNFGTNKVVAASLSNRNKETAPSPLKGLQDSQVRNVVQDIILFYNRKYQKPIPEELIISVLDTLTKHTDDPAAAINAVYAEVTDPRQIESPIALAYNNHRYRTEVGPGLQLELIRYLLPNSGVIVNVGAGNNALSEYVVSAKPKITSYIGTDVSDKNVAKSTDPRIEFRKQGSEDKLPIKEDANVDAVIMIYALHHMGNAAASLVHEAYRILKPGGILIILEDTWSDQVSPTISSTPLDEFLALKVSQRYAVFEFIDWYNNHLIKGYFEMPMPMLFKTLEQWTEFFTMQGFDVEKTEFLGLPELPFSPKLPMGIAVLKKPSSIPIQQMLDNASPVSILGKKLWLPVVIMVARPVLKWLSWLMVKAGFADRSLLDAADNLEKTDPLSLVVGNERFNAGGASLDNATSTPEQGLTLSKKLLPRMQTRYPLLTLLNYLSIRSANVTTTPYKAMPATNNHILKGWPRTKFPSTSVASSTVDALVKSLTALSRRFDVQSIIGPNISLSNVSNYVNLLQRGVFLSVTVSLGFAAIVYMALPAISGLLSSFVPQFLVPHLTIPINSSGIAVGGTVAGNMFTYLSVGSGVFFPFIWLMVREKSKVEIKSLVRVRVKKEDLTFADEKYERDVEASGVIFYGTANYYYILSAAHVTNQLGLPREISNPQIYIVLPNGMEIKGEIVGDSYRWWPDLSVIRIKKEGIPRGIIKVLPLGSIKLLEEVLASGANVSILGYPIGETSWERNGGKIIERQIGTGWGEIKEERIEIRAETRGGYSGGPVIYKGKIIGIVGGGYDREGFTTAVTNRTILDMFKGIIDASLTDFDNLADESDKKALAKLVHTIKPESLGAAAARPDDEEPLTLPLLGQLISEDTEEAEEAGDETMQLAARLITEGFNESEIETMDVELRGELEQIIKGLGPEGTELKFEDVKDEDLLALYRGILAKHAMAKITIIDDKHPDYLKTVSNPPEQLNNLSLEFKTNPKTKKHPLFRLTAVTEEQYDALLGVWLTPEHEDIAQARQKANEMLFEKIKIFLTPKYVEKTEDWQDKEDSFQFKVFFKAPLEGWPLSYVILGSAPGKSKRDFNENFITNLKKTGKPDAGTLQTLNSHFANSNIIPVHIHTTFQLRNAKERSEFSDVVKDILDSNQAEIARWAVTEDDWSQLIQAGKEYESVRKKITDELMALERQERVETIKEELAGINAQLNEWSQATQLLAPDAPGLETISENLVRLSDEVDRLGDSALSELYQGTRQFVSQLQKPRQQLENVNRLQEKALYRVSQAIKTDVEWFIASNIIKELRNFSQDVHFKIAQPELNQKLESFLAELNNLNEFIQTVQPSGFSHKDFVAYLEALGRLFNEAGGLLVMTQSQYALGGFSSQPEMYFQLAESALVTDLVITMLLDWTISVGKYEKLLKKADLKKIRLGRPYKVELLVPPSIPDLASSLVSLLDTLEGLQSMTRAIVLSELPEYLLLQAVTPQWPSKPSPYDELLTYLPIVRDELEKTGHSAASTPLAVIHLLKIPYLLRMVLDYGIIGNTLNINEFTKLVEPGYTVAENLGLLPEVKQLLSYKKRSKEFKDVSPLSVNLVKQLWRRGGTRLSLVPYLLLPVLSAMASFGLLAIAYMALPAISGLLTGFVPEFLVLQLNIPINSGGFAVVGNSSNLLWYIGGLAWIGWSAAFMIGAARAGGSVLKKINEDSMEEATLQIMPLKARGLAELLFPAGKITEAFYNRRNAKKALFNFTLHAAEDGLVYIKISNIVIPSKRRRTGNIVPFMKSPVTWLRTAHLLSRDELPTQEELEKTALQIKKQITYIATEIERLRETVKSPADNLKPLGTQHGLTLALDEGQREDLSVTLKGQAGELETVFNSGFSGNRVSENMLSGKTQEYENGFRLGWRVGQAAQQGKAGATDDLIKKADSKIADTSLYVLDVTDGELQEHAVRGFNDFIKNRDGTELLLVSRAAGLSAEEVKQRAYETLEGKVAVDNHMLASLIAESAVRDNGSLQSVMRQVYIDGELRNRINTESFIKTLARPGQKAGVRIFTSDFYGWTPVNNKMAKLVQILLLVTNNIMVDMTTGIDRAYEIKKVVNKQA